MLRALEQVDVPERDRETIDACGGDESGGLVGVGEACAASRRCRPAGVREVAELSFDGDTAVVGEPDEPATCRPDRARRGHHHGSESGLHATHRLRERVRLVQQQRNRHAGRSATVRPARRASRSRRGRASAGRRAGIRSRSPPARAPPPPPRRPSRASSRPTPRSTRPRSSPARAAASRSVSGASGIAFQARSAGGV